VAHVGIDLGTTNSLVAVMGEGEPRTIPNELGEHLTPSAVAVAEDGTLLVGRAARDRIARAPDAGRAFFKRDMGTSARYRFGDRQWSPTECSAAVLRELKRVAEAHLGTAVETAVVSVPAYFHDPQRRATIEAARVAGLRVERLVNEPTAAAMAFGYRAGPEHRRLLVFDLGGGTFDVTVLETFEGVVEVRASAGDSRLGGEDYTDALLAVVLGPGGVPARDPAWGRLRALAEVAKRSLTDRESVDVDLGDRRVTVSRDRFVSATAAITARIRPLLRRCLLDARLAPGALDDVLLVGGATRMPHVRALVEEEFGRPGNRLLDPDRAVALGAAVHAAMVARHEAVRDLVLTDVCPHSLGVETAKAFGAHVQPGFFAPILDRNLTVPVSRSERFHTMNPLQDEIDVRVFQGESRRTSENVCLGSFNVRGLQHRPAQKSPGEVDLRFTYDANGVLEVEATVVESGQKVVKVIECNPGVLSPQELRDAVEALQPLKIRPRDLLPHRARLERAYRLFAETTGERRAVLSARLDAYETSLEAGNADAIGFTAALLDEAIGDAYALEGEDAPGGPAGGRGA
jgi:molecular chaperone HscC